MLKFNLKIALRNLLRNKVFSAINIFGLAVGMGVFLVIFQYIKVETSYDDFHHQPGNTYRITQTLTKNGESMGTSVFGTSGLGPVGKETIPEIKHFTRVHPFNLGMVITNPEKEDAYFEEKIWYVDSTFLSVFDFPLKYGDPEQILNEKYSIVVTEPLAEKYFGETDPIGKTLKINSGVLGGDFIVSGVLEQLPVNSHLQFDFLIPLPVLLENYGQYKEDDGWLWDDFVTYISVDPSTEINILKEKYEAMIQTHAGEEYLNEHQQREIGFQKVEDVHLHSRFSREMAVNNSSIQNIRILSLIAVFILLMAWLNYINLSTAHALNRAKEIGIKKSIGAMKTQIISQIMIESALVNIATGILAVLIAILSVPLIGQLIGNEIKFDFLYEPKYLGYFIGMIVLGTSLSGFYPAIILSSYKPVSIFNVEKISHKGGLSLRKSLIIFQFVISALLISGTFLVYQQLSFMKSQNLGFDLEKVLVIKGPRLVIESVMESDHLSLGSKYDEFRNEATRHHSITSVTATSSVPGKGSSFKGEVRELGNAADTGIEGDFILADTDFINAYGLELISALPVPQQVPEWSYVMLNEEAVKALGIVDVEEILGADLEFFDYKVKVLGVVKNVYWNSLRELQTPTFFILDNEYGAYLSVKMGLSNIAESLAHLENSFKSTFPGDPFEYFFLEDSFNHQYQSDLRFGQLFTAFSLIAIIIACLGLFALVSHSSILRTKEIGIRKVMGASVGSVVKLLTVEYVILILVGIAIATPIAFYGARIWLDNYAYKVHLGPNLIIVPAVVILVIAILTVSFRSVMAALANPIQSLKND